MDCKLRKEVVPMKKLITDRELVSCLENIKEEVQVLDLTNNCQVLFLNLESFYNYIDDVSFVKTGHSSNLRTMMDMIGEFIPMNVSEKHIELFMMAASSKDEKMLDYVDSYIEKITKISFINSIYHAHSKKAWEDIKNVCRAMRDYHEEGSTLAKKSAYSSYFSKFF